MESLPPDVTSNAMTDYELKNIDSEDIDDLLVKMEKSFGIEFSVNELTYISTFGQLCDHVSNKIKLANVNDCTSQQAFYKLCNAISTEFQIDKNTISTNFLLVNVLPRHSRRLRTKKIEKNLGFKLNILRPPHWVTVMITFLLITSFVGLFINWRIGLLVFVFSIILLWFAGKIGNELDLQTVGQVAEKMTRENYLKSRRNTKSFNKSEIEKVLIDWFSNDLDLDKSKLTREAKFV
jgi:acyl carrier protein